MPDARWLARAQKDGRKLTWRRPFESAAQAAERKVHELLQDQPTDTHQHHREAALQGVLRRRHEHRTVRVIRAMQHVPVRMRPQPTRMQQSVLDDAHLQRLHPLTRCVGTNGGAQRNSPDQVSVPTTARAAPTAPTARTLEQPPYIN
jgi:hypothetical protein